MKLDIVSCFDDGLARVRREDGMWNFMDVHHNILYSNQWFIWVGEFVNETARVQREDGMWNFLTKRGELLSNRWFRKTVNFFRGFAQVQREDGLWNFMDNRGNILSPNQWFNTILTTGKVKVVRINGKYFFLDIKNQLHRKIL